MKMEYNRGIPCPPTPKKGYGQHYDRNSFKWVYIKKIIQRMPCPPTPLRDHKTIYNIEKRIWEQIRIEDKDNKDLHLYDI